MTINRTTGQQDADFTKRVTEALNLDAITAVEFVRQNFSPDDVFSDYDLDAWAKENGYVKED